jgi:hypothetical protein
MPKTLFIRVKAETYDEREVPRTWPVLYNAVWPDKDLEGVNSLKKLARELAPDRAHGALELAQGFVELVRFGDLPEGADKTALRAKAGALESLLQSLDEALGNRDVQAASTACDGVEAALDAVESALRDSL